MKGSFQSKKLTKSKGEKRLTFSTGNTDDAACKQTTLEVNVGEITSSMTWSESRSSKRKNKTMITTSVIDNI